MPTVPVPGFIPSPSSGTFHLGPIPLHMYGLLLAVGVVVGTLIAERRWQQWGHDRREISNIIVVVVICGVVGARLYHVATDYQLFYGHWIRVAEIWRGGLSIWGVIIGGALGVIVMTRRHHYDTVGILDATTVGILVAQGIGRWGNYFNQELYGRPTRLPWGLRIDQAHQSGILARYRSVGQYGYYQPTFLYEFIWDLIGVGVLLWVDRRFTIRRPALFALYVVWYTTFRTFEEILRIDPSNYFLGMRINFWVSLILWIAAVAFFIWWQFIRAPSEPSEPKAKPRKIET